jgi:hypothetical protein
MTMPAPSARARLSPGRRADRGSATGGGWAGVRRPAPPLPLTSCVASEGAASAPSRFFSWLAGTPPPPVSSAAGAPPPWAFPCSSATRSSSGAVTSKASCAGGGGCSAGGCCQRRVSGGFRVPRTFFRFRPRPGGAGDVPSFRFRPRPGGAGDVPSFRFRPRPGRAGDATSRAPGGGASRRPRRRSSSWTGVVRTSSRSSSTKDLAAASIRCLSEDIRRAEHHSAAARPLARLFAARRLPKTA